MTPHSRLIREVNDRIYEILGTMGPEDGDFLCECDDVDCLVTIQLTLPEYAALQGQENRSLLLAPKHQG